MNLKQLDILLEKYYAGKTSLEEEREIKRFLSNPSLPKKYDAEKMMFGFYEEEKKITAPEIQFENPQFASKTVNMAYKQRNFWSIISGIAALFLIFMAIKFYSYQNNEPMAQKDTYEDARLAYLETKKALLMISTKMNKGTENLEKLQRIEEEMKKLNSVEKFERNIKHIHKVEKFDKEFSKINKIGKFDKFSFMIRKKTSK